MPNNDRPHKDYVFYEGKRDEKHFYNAGHS